MNSLFYILFGHIRQSNKQKIENIIHLCNVNLATCYIILLFDYDEIVLVMKVVANTFLCFVLLVVYREP